MVLDGQVEGGVKGDAGERMSSMRYGLFIRGQFPQGDDMTARFGELVERARLADTWLINPHQKVETIERQVALYRTALAECGKPFPGELPMMREIFVAPTRADAIRIAKPFLEEKYKVYREWGQDKAMQKGDDDLALAFDELAEGRFLLGAPDEVAEQIAGYRERLGVTNMILGIQWVGMPQAQVLDSMHMFAEEVMPKVAR